MISEGTHVQPIPAIRATKIGKENRKFCIKLWNNKWRKHSSSILLGKLKEVTRTRGCLYMTPNKALLKISNLLNELPKAIE